MMRYGAVIALLFWNLKEFYSAEGNESKCEYTLVPDLKKCKENGSYSIFPRLTRCVQDPVCEKTFHVSLVDLEPFSSEDYKFLLNLLHVCCGPCTKTSNIMLFDDVTQLNSSSINASHAVFPVLGRANAKRVRTYYFLPIIRVQRGYFITKKQSPEELLQRFIGSLGNLWPLLVVMLTLAVLAGFVIWMMETWVNKEQFSRSFRTGLFDGFWWSFISMTTVGYGDKAPKFIGSRLFSVLWILVGITICSMFTASLTAELSGLINSPPAVNLDGTKVGVLRNRLLDAIIVTRQGGVIRETGDTAVIDGVVELINKTRSGNDNDDNDIKGFFLDQFTFMYVEKEFKANKTKEANFFKNDAEITNVLFEGEEMAYGILLKHVSDYNYFKEFIKDNQDTIETCMRVGLNEVRKETEKFQSYLFSPSADLFFPILIGNAATVGVILCFGIMYEIFRVRLKKNKQVRRETSNNNKKGNDAECKTFFE